MAYGGGKTRKAGVVGWWKGREGWPGWVEFVPVSRGRCGFEWGGCFNRSWFCPGFKTSRKLE